ncbi:helix-turn-helix domain-containing protein [Cellulomonas humilata]|uniref:Excisionase family DNA binding protein n=1 Tax=Cellulomonas humilata TaxID=144055 RepID=A0ABU0EKY9_9CELL|nr:helix-turn-helix domain-containing protein [Cellulomonas humilata]MDQ0375944.1 excisionase family DNA binding protein [Cellulomonas humilata]
MSTLHVDEAPRARMLLSVADVAAELGCGRDTVYGLLASGLLPSVLVGERLRRIRLPDLEQYIAGLPTSPPSPRS